MTVEVWAGSLFGLSKKLALGAPKPLDNPSEDELPAAAPLSVEERAAKPTAAAPKPPVEDLEEPKLGVEPRTDASPKVGAEPKPDAEPKPEPEGASNDEAVAPAAPPKPEKLLVGVALVLPKEEDTLPLGGLHSTLSLYFTCSLATISPSRPLYFSRLSSIFSTLVRSCFS